MDNKFISTYKKIISENIEENDFESLEIEERSFFEDQGFKFNHSTKTWEKTFHVQPGASEIVSIKSEDQRFYGTLKLSCDDPDIGEKALVDLGCFKLSGCIFEMKNDRSGSVEKFYSEFMRKVRALFESLAANMDIE